jgi:hypothetical protein
MYPSGGGPPHGLPGSNLSLGWGASIDPVTGRTYCYNSAIGQSQYYSPTATPGGFGGGHPASGLSSGYIATTDPSSGRTYYYNRATGLSQWHPPTASALDHAGGSQFQSPIPIMPAC